MQTESEAVGKTIENSEATNVTTSKNGEANEETMSVEDKIYKAICDSKNKVIMSLAILGIIDCFIWPIIKDFLPDDIEFYD